MALYAENIDIRWRKGTADKLYQLSKTIKQWEAKHLEQLISAAKMGYPVYVQLYDELLKSEGRAYQGVS